MTTGEVHDTGTRRQALENNPRFDLVRPVTPAPGLLENLKAPNKPVLHSALRSNTGIKCAPSEQRGTDSGNGEETQLTFVCTVSIELARARWVVGILPPKSSKVLIQSIAGGDAHGLLALLDRIRARLEKEHAAQIDPRLCYECGYDGFWLARFLKGRGIEVLVLDPSSFLVSRRGRRAKTDRIDAEAMAFQLRAYLNGDESVFRTVSVPAPETEDAKRISRERTQLVSERTRHINRIRALHGIREIKSLFGGARHDQLEASRTGDGRPLGQYLKAEIAREFERLALVRQQIQRLEVERAEALADPTAPFPLHEKVATLKKLNGIGEPAHQRHDVRGSLSAQAYRNAQSLAQPLVSQPAMPACATSWS